VIYHLLDKPIKLMPNGKVEWHCLCGQPVALPPQKVPRLTPIQVADEKTGANIVECAACYAGEDEKGEVPPPVGASMNEQENRGTLDDEIAADNEDDQELTPDQLSGQPPAPVDDGAVLGEEDEEYPA